jgi:ATP adenylyltransferase
MDYLWTPWRYSYIAAGVKDDRCIFCDAAEARDDAQSLIVLRAKKNAHQATLTASEPETLAEMMALAQRIQLVLESLYRPDGYNVGMNIGRAAGAGIAGHLHLHVLPRWFGDTNFMTTVGETRVQPEELTTTYQRLSGALSA